MRTRIPAVLAFIYFSVACGITAGGEDIAGQVKKAIEKSTLDQPGTEPFHLEASYAPSFERDKDSNRQGEIEIWWESPTRWRWDVRSPEFHQLMIVDGNHQWQKNEGDYFPEWLRELAVALIHPVPLPIDVLLDRVRGAQVRSLHLPVRVNGQITFNEQRNVDWDPTGAPGDAQANGKGYLALLNGQLSYTGGPGWSGGYRDFQNYHGRLIARTVTSGYLEVTAKVTTLEDLGTESSSLFNTDAPGADAQSISTLVLDEADLRKNLLSGSELFNWPPLKDGPLEGQVWTEVVIDRTGKVREMRPPIADNPGVAGAADEGFREMQFQPFLRGGIPVQVTGRLSVHFKTVRPAEVENFESARTYFNQGRKIGFPAAGAAAPYVLRAEFYVGTSAGVQTGRYEDTWNSSTEWKREAWIGDSHFVRSQSGEKHYRLAEGPDAIFLSMIFMLIEPIPADDTMTESDWRIRRDQVEKASAVCVFRGTVGSNGELDPEKSQAFWFSSDGQLVKAHTSGLDVLPSKIEPFGDVQLARQIDVMQNGKLALRISIESIEGTDPATAEDFQFIGHEWQRAFTAEER